jgi:hypothetical protein
LLELGDRLLDEHVAVAVHETLTGSDGAGLTALERWLVIRRTGGGEQAGESEASQRKDPIHEASCREYAQHAGSRYYGKEHLLVTIRDYLS